MRREKHTPDPLVVKMLGERPGERKSVERRGGAPYLVEDDETVRGRVSQDVRGLSHLHEKRRFAPHERVRCADAREDAVREADRGRKSGHEGARVREEDEKRVLPQIRGVAARARAREDEEMRAAPPES